MGDVGDARTGKMAGMLLYVATCVRAASHIMSIFLRVDRDLPPPQGPEEVVLNVKAKLDRSFKRESGELRRL